MSLQQSYNLKMQFIFSALLKSDLAGLSMLQMSLPVVVSCSSCKCHFRLLSVAAVVELLLVVLVLGAEVPVAEVSHARKDVKPESGGE
jgi:hypothetical protein